MTRHLLRCDAEKFSGSNGDEKMNRESALAVGLGEGGRGSVGGAADWDSGGGADQGRLGCRKLNLV